MAQEPSHNLSLSSLIRRRVRLLTLAIALTSLAVISAACSNNEDPTPTPTLGLTFPYIFSGTFTVDGEPGPAGSSIFTMMNGRPTGDVANAPREGSYSNVLAGANTSADIGAEITFHLGDPNGDSVKAEEKYEFNPAGSAQFLTLELTFPRSP